MYILLYTLVYVKFSVYFELPGNGLAVPTPFGLSNKPPLRGVAIEFTNLFEQFFFKWDNKK